jgi:hypothetical protein
MHFDQLILLAQAACGMAGALFLLASIKGWRRQAIENVGRGRETVQADEQPLRYALVLGQLIALAIAGLICGVGGIPWMVSSIELGSVFMAKGGLAVLVRIALFYTCSVVAIRLSLHMRAR